MNKFFTLLLGLMALSTSSLFSQVQNSVSIGTLNPDPSSILDVSSATKGVLVPRLTSNQIQAISTPANGLLVYNTDSGCYSYYRQNIGQWRLLCNTDSLIVSSARIDTIHAITINSDTIYSNIIHADTVYANVGRIDTIYSSIIHADTIYSNVIYTDTLYAELGIIDTIYSKTVHTDSLFLEGVEIREVISDSLDQAWRITGNSNITPSNFIGTTTNQDVVMKRNQVEFMRLEHQTTGIVNPIDSNLIHASARIRITGGQPGPGKFLMSTDNQGTAVWTDDPTPCGTIVMWGGNISQIPTGWYLCDGTNNTPDLRDKFIRGSSGSGDHMTSGGTDQITLNVNQLPAHNHSVSTITTSSSGSHTHGFSGNTDNDGAHEHSFWAGNGSAGAAFDKGDADDERSYHHPNNSNVSRHSHHFSGTTNSDGAHTHTLSGNTDNTGADQAITILPSYYKLAYIHKCLPTPPCVPIGVGVPNAMFCALPSGTVIYSDDLTFDPNTNCGTNTWMGVGLAIPPNVATVYRAGGGLGVSRMDASTPCLQGILRWTKQ